MARDQHTGDVSWMEFWRRFRLQLLGCLFALAVFVGVGVWRDPAFDLERLRWIGGGALIGLVVFGGVAVAVQVVRRRRLAR